MRAILLSTLALGALTSAALAEQPLTLTGEQMDAVTAGARPEAGFGRFTAFTTENTPITGPLELEPQGLGDNRPPGEGRTTAFGFSD
jgi:hypothetical protein